MPTDKQPKHDSYASSTQKSISPDRPKSRPYQNGANVHKGGRVPRDPDGPVGMAGPKRGSKDND